jgi:hypothetical protein
MRLAVRIIIWTFALIPTAVTTVFSADLTVTSFSDYAGQTNIVLQATDNVIFGGGSMNLPALPPGASSGLLSVQAGNDIIIQDGTSISAGQGWSLSFLAGNNLSLTGTGSITAAGDIMIQTGGQIEMANTGSGLPIASAGTIVISEGGQPITITNLDGQPIQPTQLIFLNSQINRTNITAVAGTNVLIAYIPPAYITPLRFQWFKNGRKLNGETNDFLSLTNIRLADAGNFSVVVPDNGGRITINVQLHVRPCPRGAEHQRETRFRIR